MEQQITAFARVIGDRVYLQVWNEPAQSGICCSAYLPREVAERLIVKLQEAVAVLPREASAADLGITA